MKDIDKISDWCNNYTTTVQTIFSQYNEPSLDTYKQNLLASKNDYLFYMLIINSIDKEDDKDFINQSQLFNMWKQYLSSQNTFSTNIASCKNDQPCYPHNFDCFIKEYCIFNFDSPHPLHIPKNFSFFFHTLFSSWTGNMHTRYGARDSAMAVIDLWNNFQHNIQERCANCKSTNKDFYLSPKFNLKLFRLLFHIDSELIEDNYKRRNDTLQSNSIIVNHILGTTYSEIVQSISYAQQHISYPCIELAILNVFQKKLDKLYYTSKDFSYKFGLIKSDLKTVKYTSTKDPTIDILSEHLISHINDLKEYILSLKTSYFYIFDYNGTSIYLPNSENDLKNYSESLQNKFNQISSNIIEEIQAAQKALIENKINATICFNMEPILDSFYEYFQKMWTDSTQRHFYLINYNIELQVHPRRQISIIEQNANCFYPIDDFFKAIQEEIPRMLKKAKQATGQESIATSAYVKQQEISSLCSEVTYRVDNYSNLIDSLNEQLPILHCSPKSLYSYLCEQNYFTD